MQGHSGGAFKACGGRQREPQSGCEFVADESFQFWGLLATWGLCHFLDLFVCACVCVVFVGGGCDSASLLHFCVACGAAAQVFRASPNQFKKMAINEQNRTQ
jgi:hypothetical protein